MMSRKKIARSIVLLSFLGLAGSILWIPQPSMSQTVSSSTRKVRPSRIPPPFTLQSKELAEVERLNHQVIELENQGKFKEATPLAERALAIREKAFNPDRDGPGEGIDAAQDVDFGPYMAELQRRVKRNWNPPEQGNPRRSMLRFSISRNGEVSNLRVGKSSGDPDSDVEAMNAVRRAAPFRALPIAYTQRNIDIQFTFDIYINGINVDGIKVDGENKRPTEPAVDRPAYDHSKSYKSSD